MLRGSITLNSHHTVFEIGTRSATSARGNISNLSLDKVSLLPGDEIAQSEYGVA